MAFKHTTSGNDNVWGTIKMTTLGDCYIIDIMILITEKSIIIKEAEMIYKHDPSWCGLIFR